MEKVVHFEIPADNLGRAEGFYKGVFGWGIEKVPMPDVNYFMATTTPVDAGYKPSEPGAINGALMERGETGRTPVLVIEVPSIEDSMKKVEAAGGKIVLEKHQVGEYGYYARFTDPEGNVLGLWQLLGGA